MSDDSKIEAKPIGIWPSLQRTARFNQPVETPISIFFLCLLAHREVEKAAVGAMAVWETEASKSVDILAMFHGLRFPPYAPYA